MQFNLAQKCNEAIKYLGTFKFWKELVIMTLGMMVTAAAVYYFLVPSNEAVITTSLQLLGPSTRLLRTRAVNLGLAVTTSLNMSSKSSRKTPFGQKANRRIFSSADNLGLISSR